MRRTIAIAVALMLVLAGCSQAPGASTTLADETQVDETQVDETQVDETQADAPVKPDDPDSDVLGWEDGYWYNETVEANPDDGLNETELNRTVARAMARVERVRGLEFEKRVPVEIRTREEFRESRSGGDTPPKRRLFDNVKFESLFLINESTDSIAVQNANSGSSVGGFYSPSKDSIVVVSDAGNAASPMLDELTLAHELTHAVQDQHFDLSRFNQSTRDLHNAKSGIIEGDANYVQHLYSNRCGAEWNGACSIPNGSSSSGGGIANMGVYLLKYQPYSDGPAFVRDIRRKGGWDAVDDVYRNPPASTEQVIHPDKYGEDAPAEIRIDDSNSGDWERLRLKGRPSYGSVGEAGVFSMFMSPYYETQGQTQLIPARQFFNVNQSTGELRQFDPLNYNSSYSDGWDADRLAVYTNESAPANETGYVWKLEWDTERDAREFATGYREMLKYRNATKVDGRANTWRIPESDEFADAFYVQRQGTTVVVVNAPTVEDLSEVRQGAAPER